MIPNIQNNILGSAQSNIIKMDVPVMITHSEQTFESTWRGVSGEVLTVRWGDGEETTHTFTGSASDVAVDHNYAAPGTYTVRFFVDVLTVYRLVITAQAVSSGIAEFARLGNLTYYNITTQPVTGDVGTLLAVLPDLQYVYSYSATATLTCSLRTWPCTGLILQNYNSAVPVSADVGNVLINSAGVQTSGSLSIASSCPAPPGTPEVTAALAQLASDGVTVTTN